VKVVHELGQLISFVKLALIIRMPECVLERVGICTLEDDHLPYQDRLMVMETQRNRVCGADIHKKFLIATILSRDGRKIVKRFGMTIDDLLKFKNWIMENQCEKVAVESTGTYWIPIHAVLEGTIDLTVANAYKIKHTPGRKTDTNDSEWLLLNFALTA
jgi:hypothetical protein